MINFLYDIHDKYKVMFMVFVEYYYNIKVNIKLFGVKNELITM